VIGDMTARPAERDSESRRMRVAIPVANGVDLLDVAGPIEMFSWAGGPIVIEPVVLSVDGNPVTSLNGLRFDAHRSFADAGDIDVLWVPGHAPAVLTELMTGPDTRYLDFLKRTAATSTYVCSVCEGALLLAQAGLLDGYAATTHWAFVSCLKRFDAIKVDETNPRFVLDRNRLTGGGISSALDESLKLIELLAGREAAETAQLSTQYFPEPPVSADIPPAPRCPVQF
jgi:transcriptional regulator GlxA family with amidase domain